MSSGKWRPFCPGLNVLMLLQLVNIHMNASDAILFNIVSITDEMHIQLICSNETILSQLNNHKSDFVEKRSRTRSFQEPRALFG